MAPFFSRKKSADEKTALVRRFSDRFAQDEPEEELALSVGFKELLDKNEERSKAPLAIKQWRSMFADTEEMCEDEDLRNLERATKELAKTYEKFQKNAVPDGEHTNVKDKPISLREAMRAVQSRRDNYDLKRETSKTGKLKAVFVKICASFENHSYMFAIVPSNDKYTCLVTGTLAAIVKAADIHDEAVRELGIAFDDMFNTMDFLRRRVDMSKANKPIERIMANCWICIFQFLVTIMNKWFKSGIRRLRTSFNKDFCQDTIQTFKHRMQALSQRLDREYSLEGDKGMARIEEKVQELPDAILIRQIIEEAVQAKLEPFRQLLDLACLGQQSQTFLHGSGFLDTSYAQITNGGDTRSRSASPESTLYDAKMDHITVPTLKLHAAKFRPHGANALEDALVRQSRSLRIQDEVYQRVQRISSSSTSETLWIQGPAQVPRPSQMSLTAAYLAATARQANIDTVVFFFKRRIELADEERGFEKELIRMTYSFVYQMIEQLDNDSLIEDKSLLDQLDDLDESLGSVSTAIDIIAGLLKIGNDPMFFIVDGLQELSYKAKVEQDLVDLVETLRNPLQKNKHAGGRVSKTLFTTDGNATALHTIPAADRLHSRDGVAPRTSGGKRALSALRLSGSRGDEEKSKPLPEK